MLLVDAILLLSVGIIFSFGKDKDWKVDSNSMVYTYIVFKSLFVIFRFLMWILEEYVSQIGGYCNLFYMVFWLPTMSIFFIIYLSHFFQPNMDDCRKNASTKYISVVMILIEAFISLTLLCLLLIALTVYVIYLVASSWFLHSKVEDENKKPARRAEVTNKSTLRIRAETESRIDV